MSDPMARAEPYSPESKTFFGFWTYLMTDCMLFATLFATYVVLQHSTAGGPSGRELFNLPFVLTETIILLTSSFTAGIAVLGIQRQSRGQIMTFLIITFVLGAAFLGLELSEFSRLAADGSSWQRSGFLSAFFTLVGTHGLHIASGLLWLVVVATQLWQRGVTAHVARRLTLFGLFWHFLDVVWIFIFTIVYLMGVL